MYGRAWSATHDAGVISPYGPYIESHGGSPVIAPPKFPNRSPERSFIAR